MINQHDEVSVEEAYISIWNFKMGIDYHGDKVTVSRKHYEEAVLHLETAPVEFEYIQTDMYETYCQQFNRIFGNGNWNDNIHPWAHFGSKAN